jgi:hypothetical protein
MEGELQLAAHDNKHRFVEEGFRAQFTAGLGFGVVTMPERTGGVKNLYCIGTLDTKGPEIHFLAECLSSALARFQIDNVSSLRLHGLHILFSYINLFWGMVLGKVFICM